MLARSSSNHDAIMTGVMKRAGVCAALVAMVGVLLAGVSAADADDGPVFNDVDGHRHELAVAAMVDSGLFEQLECAPGRFCPNDPAPRRVVAVWLHNALTNRDTPIAAAVFADTSDSDDYRWRHHADALYEMGVTYGCRAEPLRFCPDRAVTRGQLAALLSRAYGFAGTNHNSASFDDMTGSIFASDAAGVYEANVMDACATDPLRFCSGLAVTRGELAEALRTTAQLADGAARTGSVCALAGTNHDSVGFRSRRQDTTAGMVLPRWGDGLSTGRLRTAFVFGTYRNRVPEYDTHTEADIQLAELDAYLTAMSYGRFELDAEVYHGWIEVPFDYLYSVSPTHQTCPGRSRSRPGWRDQRSTKPAPNTGWTPVRIRRDSGGAAQPMVRRRTRPQRLSQLRFGLGSGAGRGGQQLRGGTFREQSLVAHRSA